MRDAEVCEVILQLVSSYYLNSSDDPDTYCTARGTDCFLLPWVLVAPCRSHGCAGHLCTQVDRRGHVDEAGVCVATLVFAIEFMIIKMVFKDEPLLHWGGVRPNDSTDGKHVDGMAVRYKASCLLTIAVLNLVVVDGDRLLIFYFVHPGRPCLERNSLQFRQSMLQVNFLDPSIYQYSCALQK